MSELFRIQELVQILGELTPVERDRSLQWEAEGFSTLWILERVLKDREEKDGTT